jgi:MMPL family
MALLGGPSSRTRHPSGRSNPQETSRTYEPTPEGFDPLTASAEALRRHGLPRRTDPDSEPELARLWKRVFARPVKFETAELAMIRPGALAAAGRQRISRLACWRVTEVISADLCDVAVLEMGEDESGADDVSHFAGAGGDVLEGAPALGEQGEPSFARTREETRRAGTRPGTLRGLSVTGGVITAAGIVLAGTFAALAQLPSVSLTEVGTAVAIGVLLDTLLVRTVLVPATFLSIGEHIWWPRRGLKGLPSLCDLET